MRFLSSPAIVSLIFVGSFFCAYAQEAPISLTPNGGAALKEILSDLHKPKPTSAPVLKYRCSEQGVKEALSDLIKLTYRSENVQRELAGRKQRMLNELEKVMKSANRDPQAFERFEAIEKDNLDYINGLVVTIKEIGKNFLSIQPMHEVCDLDTVVENRAATDLNRRIKTFELDFIKLTENPVKLRDALGKVRTAMTAAVHTPEASR